VAEAEDVGAEKKGRTKVRAKARGVADRSEMAAKIGEDAGAGEDDAAETANAYSGKAEAMAGSSGNAADKLQQKHRQGDVRLLRGTMNACATRRIMNIVAFAPMRAGGTNRPAATRWRCRIFTKAGSTTWPPGWPENFYGSEPKRQGDVGCCG
jgi:hypothetical protein